MKKFTPILLLVLICGLSTMSFAQNSEKGTIKTTEQKKQVVLHKDLEYHIIDGIWYLKANEKYILRQAPKGARLKNLPEGGENVVMGGRKYYKRNGVFYKKIKEGLYEVARP